MAEEVKAATETPTVKIDTMQSKAAGTPEQTDEQRLAEIKRQMKA